MALLVMIFRKMIKNKWLQLSLLLGLIVSVALVSSIPVYTTAVLQRMLIKDLQVLQRDTNVYPGNFSVNAIVVGGTSMEDVTKRFSETDSFMKEEAGKFGLPLQAYKRERITERIEIKSNESAVKGDEPARSGDFVAMSELQEHIKLLDGRMPAKEPVNGVYEVLVTNRALTGLKTVLDTELWISVAKSDRSIRIKPVGVMDIKDSKDVYWLTQLGKYGNSFFIDYDLFHQKLLEESQLKIISSSWSFAHDYNKLSLESISNYTEAKDRITNYFKNQKFIHEFNTPITDTVNEYYAKEQKLRQMLWSLNVPVLIMLAYYLFMVANLITERQKTEIAVLRSRGASRLQIMMAYTIEGLVLGAIAFLLGPYLALILTKMLGASSGFLEFVQRATLEAKLKKEPYQYALIAVVASVIMTLIPAFLATGVSIVGHKQKQGRSGSKSFWHKFYLDIIFLGVAIYGLVTFRSRMEDLRSLGIDSSTLGFDPLLFIVPALFIMGMGLLILRLYPYIISLVYLIGRKWWSPALYFTLIHVGRSTRQYQFIMVFLIITISIGTFSASAARTINQNTDDRIRYVGGADVTLQVKWEDDSSLISSSTQVPGQSNQNSQSPEELVPRKVQYSEPPFQPIADLPGVQYATKVFNKEKTTVSFSKGDAITQLMGIETANFGRITWMRDQLLDYHYYNYLNLLAKDPAAVLISRSLAKQFDVKPGEYITMSWPGSVEARFNVYGIIDYWPSWNPNPQPAKDGAKASLPNLVVGHLPYIQNHMALEPYEVWMKLDEETTMQQFYGELSKSDFRITQFSNAKQELVNSRTDPFRLAINGVMTLGFVISIVVSFLGFILFWVLSLTSRVLQFGIFRAMGISFPQLIGVLIAEQLLTSGAAIVIGGITGYVASTLFVPFFQLSFNTTTQVPPFEVAFQVQDQIQLFSIITFMLLVGLLILGVMLSRIKINQAIKLGEDG